MKKERLDIEENIATAQEGYQDLPENLQQKLAWFKDQKIGVIFHWGLYAAAGIVESWQLSEEDTWARKEPWRDNLSDLRHDYWELNKQFDPRRFDAAEWAAACRKAGFKYMIFTTKHHDGFTMYDTHVSDYKITAKDCPFHSSPDADVFKSLSQAFRDEEIAVGAYYSKPDWHCPYYWEPGARPKGRYASYDPLEKPQLWKKYNQFVKDQLVELSSNYGAIDILWLDGGWVNHANHEFLDMDDIARSVRRHQPDMLIVDRTIGGQYENYVTPERKIPDVVPKKAWESNIPLAKNWGYVPNDVYKSFDEILTSLVKIVSLGGNVIFGVGPKPDGTLPEEALALMSKLGTWLSHFGEAIYGTRPYSTTELNGTYFTQTADAVYAFVGQEAPHELNLTELGLTAASATLMNSRAALAVAGNLVSVPASDALFQVVKFVKI